MIIDYDSSDVVITIKGTDGYVPMYQPDARWTTWSIDDIWVGVAGKKKHIPKINDWVVVPTTGDLYRVISRDASTMVSKLKRMSINSTVDVDEIVAITDQSFRVYYDRSQTPYTLAVEDLLKTHSYQAVTYRIYRGVLLELDGGVSPDNTILSRVYNNSGDFVGHDAPLYWKPRDSHDSDYIRTYLPCNTNVELKNGETVTVVTFDSNGKIVTKYTALIEETTYIPTAYANTKYITNIYMKTAFMDELKGNVINFPANMTLNSLNPIGVIVYNDGTEEEHIVDGKKFDLYGLGELQDVNKSNPKHIVNSFAATTIGHKVPLQLVYKMNQGESTIMPTFNNPNLIRKRYSLVVTEPNRSYGVKLFAYPRWIDANNGYTLEFYLLNLDRDILYHVTPLVKLTTNSRAFNPKSYGATQILTYQIELSEVSAIFKKFIHSQTMEVILRGRANDDTLDNIWEVSTEYPSETPFFGSSLRAKLKATNKIVNIGNNIKTVDEWLEKTYYTTDPLVNRSSSKEHGIIPELTAPKPTHIGLTYMGETIMVRVSDYAKDITFKNVVTLYSNVNVVFYKETAGNYLYLSVCDLTVRK